MNEINANTDFQEGVIIPVDKDSEWTSFDVVNKIRSLLRYRFGFDKIKVGHAGTLDPLATGLVLICTGKATRKILELQAAEKEYLAEIRFGETTPSFDLETAVNGRFPVDHISRELVAKTLLSFTGEMLQKPPAFSAKWKDGRRAYELARKGLDPELEPVHVTIRENELISCDLPDIIVRIICGKGTYIRSFAHDLGEALNSGAYLKKLQRTRIGDYHLSDALTINDFIEKIK